MPAPWSGSAQWIIWSVFIICFLVQPSCFIHAHWPALGSNFLGGSVGSLSGYQTQATAVRVRNPAAGPLDDQLIRYCIVWCVLLHLDCCIWNYLVRFTKLHVTHPAIFKSSFHFMAYQCVLSLSWLFSHTHLHTHSSPGRQLSSRFRYSSIEVRALYPAQLMIPLGCRPLSYAWGRRWWW